jgi:hypothetical protein
MSAVDAITAAMVLIAASALIDMSGRARARRRAREAGGRAPTRPPSPELQRPERPNELDDPAWRRDAAPAWVAPDRQPRQTQSPATTPAPTAEPPARPSAAAAPGLPGARYGPDTFALLAQRADHTRRHAVAELHVRQRLQTLPAERWYIQPFLLIDGYRIPFLVLGEFGIFAIWAISLRPQWADPEGAAAVADPIKQRIPGYPGPVHSALCGFQEPDLHPWEFKLTAEHRDCWMLGVDWLVPWMEHFGHEHGLGIEDVARFKALAVPDWSRPVAPVPRGIPNFDRRAPRDSSLN